VYINRTLLIILAVTIVFIPSVQAWVTSGGSAWYRPFLVWFVLLLAAYWNQRKSYGDDL
jgi:uncharacterized membrane protein